MATTPPPWTDTAWARAVDEPFRSDSQFWAGVVASADALVVLAITTVVGAVLTLAGHQIWAFAAFGVPAALILRAGVVSAAASRQSREAFADRASWRDAERTAVAAAFFRVLVRRRIPR